MSDHKATHRSIVWSEQKLDELDALITELDSYGKNLDGKAVADANKALGRIRASRAAFKTYLDGARLEADETIKGEAEKTSRIAANARTDIEEEWVEAELAFQSFLSAASADAKAARKALVARTRAERKALETSLDKIRDETTATIEAARKEFDAALDRVSKETGKVEAGAGRISVAGAESWQAIREGLKEAHAVHVNTARKIAAAFARLS
ncbi:hypothetical protein [Ochrobactrum soli]|uniref:Uncharacterized protein n=1 Tax=Ochrobactrum soli TaxID=2448455 RepID=A0A2P9HEV8_9HYPH|nr:hypothetical protein [[Ochrobactrum] soli]SPL62615.1 hypothetical protein OHAE_5222 [[Ochrobactrum] soli]